MKVARTVWSGGKSEDNFKGLPIAITGSPKSTKTSGTVTLVGKLRVDQGEQFVRGRRYGLRGKHRGHKEHFSPDEHLSLALQVVLLLLIIGVSECG